MSEWQRVPLVPPAAVEIAARFITARFERSKAGRVVVVRVGVDVDIATGADMSTKLKLMGVDVASIGDAHGATAGSLNYVFSDEVAGIYKKLVVSADQKLLLGAVLVGEYFELDGVEGGGGLDLVDGGGEGAGGELGQEVVGVFTHDLAVVHSGQIGGLVDRSFFVVDGGEFGEEFGEGGFAVWGT